MSPAVNVGTLREARKGIFFPEQWSIKETQAALVTIRYAHQPA